MKKGCLLPSWLRCKSGGYVVKQLSLTVYWAVEHLTISKNWGCFEMFVDIKCMNDKMPMLLLKLCAYQLYFDWKHNSYVYYIKGKPVAKFGRFITSKGFVCIVGWLCLSIEIRIPNKVKPSTFMKRDHKSACLYPLAPPVLCPLVDIIYESLVLEKEKTCVNNSVKNINT